MKNLTKRKLIKRITYKNWEKRFSTVRKRMLAEWKTETETGTLCVCINDENILQKVGKIAKRNDINLHNDNKIPIYKANTTH